ncbi:hypothetical protein MNL93_09830 [Acinetobacter baumannii]|uniref:hypothetical protein n=1 Tax=Acinetobacter baumannii TaxID=470 RepID=UPI00223B05EB|nr:hypothetical protein [Acinetobacter baumannii]MCT2474169.1 hypothetical protein [Acinetobacter baumannii]
MKIIALLAPLVILLALIFLGSKQLIKQACESGNTYLAKQLVKKMGVKKRSLISSN